MRSLLSPSLPTPMRMRGKASLRHEVDERLDATMARCAAAELDLHAAEREVGFVVNHDHVPRLGVRVWW